MSVDILTLRVGIQAPDEVSVPCAEFAGLSLDLLRPSSVSCNSRSMPVFAKQEMIWWNVEWPINIICNYSYYILDESTMRE